MTLGFEDQILTSNNSADTLKSEDKNVYAMTKASSCAIAGFFFVLVRLNEEGLLLFGIIAVKPFTEVVCD